MNKIISLGLLVVSLLLVAAYFICNNAYSGLSLFIVFLSMASMVIIFMQDIDQDISFRFPY